MRQIEVDEAREFFAHPSQHIMGTSPETLPVHGVEYWANGPVCCVFHAAPWPDVFMGHYGVKPEGWGRLVAPTRAVLAAFFEEKRAHRIIGWTEKSNRPAIAFARRLGFGVDGVLPLPSGEIVMQGWTPCQ